MNILVISHIYPGGGTPETYTPVVHYFTREWIKMGHRVIVVNINTYFAKPLYHLPNYVKKFLVNKYKTVLPDKPLDKAIDFVHEGVQVVRVPIFKLKPSGVPSYKRQDKQVDYIIDKLKEYDFIPDRIVGHWINPLYLGCCLKQVYSCPLTIVLHDCFEKIYGFPGYENLIDKVDLWGIRSVCMEDGFESIIGGKRKHFVCSSGIPSKMIDENTDYDRWNDRFVYVGYMLERKHPDKVIFALKELYKDSPFHLDIIGGGVMLEQIRNIVTCEKLGNQVNVAGRIKREEVPAMLDKADCFIMISRAEVFGLVYLEAMARGCIVVAGRGEGMTGIIEDGINGFLCEPGNKDELKRIVEKIRNLSPKERRRIRLNGMKTAREYTDQKCAERYLKNIYNI